MPGRSRAASQTNFRIFETNEFSKRKSKLSSHDSHFIENKLKTYIYPQLKVEPHYGINTKKLSGYDPETWRYRLGKFRLFYRIDDSEKVAYILSIDFRKDAY